MAERIGDGNEIAELVVGIGRAVAEGVDGSGMLAYGVVFCVAGVAATVDVSDLAAEYIVGNGVRYGGNRDGLQLDTITRDRQRPVGSIWDNLGRCDCWDGNMQLVFRHIAADVGRAGTSGERGGEAGELARRGGDERGNSGVGAGDDVGLGEPDGGIVEDERRVRFGLAPFRRRGRDSAPCRLCRRYAIAKNVISIFDGWLEVD